MKLKSYTLIEALLTATLLGIIAAMTITTMKPYAYNQKANTELKRKVYVELYGATQRYLAECSKNMNAETIYDNCDKTSTTTHKFGDSGKNDLNLISQKYLRGTYKAANVANSNCLKHATIPSLKLKNGVCVGTYSATNNYILVDLNGTSGPDQYGDGGDRMALIIDKNGIKDDIDTAVNYIPSDGL